MKKVVTNTSHPPAHCGFSVELRTGVCSLRCTIQPFVQSTEDYYIPGRLEIGPFWRRLAFPLPLTEVDEGLGSRQRRFLSRQPENNGEGSIPVEESRLE